MNLPELQWIPIADATKKLGISIDDLAQMIILASERDEDLPLAFGYKCDDIEVMILEGIRVRLSNREDLGDVKMKRRVVLAGYFRLHQGEETKLALRWPEPNAITGLAFWKEETNEHFTDTDLLVPIKESTKLISLADLWVRKQEFGEMRGAINRQVKETLLGIIGSLVQAADMRLDDGALSETAARVAGLCEKSGVRMNPRTVWNHLKNARELVRPLKTTRDH